MGRRHHLCGGGFEESDDVLPFHSGEPLEKLVNRIARFQVIKQRLHRYACPGKTRRTAHDLQVSRNDFPFHASIIGHQGLNSSQQKELP